MSAPAFTCSGGCGGRTNHASGKCKDCRRRKCGICGKAFSPQRAGYQDHARCKRVGRDPRPKGQDGIRVIVEEAGS